MQDAGGPQTPFEVYCNHCRVTFAAGTKRCIHCGERLARQRFKPGSAMSPEHGYTMSPEQADDLLVESETPARRGRFSPLTIIWIAVLVGGYLMRACAER